MKKTISILLAALTAAALLSSCALPAEQPITQAIAADAQTANTANTAKKSSSVMVSTASADATPEPLPNAGDAVAIITPEPVAADQSITIDDARAIALHHAGLTEADVTYVRTNLDHDDGRAEYEVEFYCGDHEYDYDIDAATGAIRSFDSEIESYHHDSHSSATASTKTSAESPVTEAQAKAIALEHAGVSESDVTFTKVKLDRDDGRLEYEVDFRTGSDEYDYKIDASTGNVLKADRDYEAPRTTASSESTNKETQQPQSSDRISEDDARKIALEHAGVSASDASFVKIELDRDDGRMEYEIEFRAGRVEYEYEINAETGKILKSEKDHDD